MDSSSQSEAESEGEQERWQEQIRKMDAMETLNKENLSQDVDILNSALLACADTKKLKKGAFKTTMDMYVDAQYIGKYAETCERQADALSTDAGLSIQDLSSKLRSMTTADGSEFTQDSFLKLTDDVNACTHHAGGSNVIFGTFQNIEKKVRKPSERTVGQTTRGVTKPLAITESSDKKVDINVLSQRMGAAMMELYTEMKIKIPYFEAVYHPESMEKTVENMYFVSLLMADGSVKMVNEEEVLYLIPISPGGRGGPGDPGDPDNTRLKVVDAVSITMNNWTYNELRQLYRKIDKPLLDFDRSTV